MQDQADASQYYWEQVLSLINDTSVNADTCVDTANWTNTRTSAWTCADMADPGAGTRCELATLLLGAC